MRRVVTPGFNRRYATDYFVVSPYRGLKPTATFTPSLRDDPAEIHPVEKPAPFPSTRWIPAERIAFEERRTPTGFKASSPEDGAPVFTPKG